MYYSYPYCNKFTVINDYFSFFRRAQEIPGNTASVLFNVNDSRMSGRGQVDD